MTTEEKLTHLRKYYRTPKSLSKVLGGDIPELAEIDGFLEEKELPVFLVQAIDREYKKVTSLRGKNGK